ncbi:MAG: tetratricopeptide repeat protein [Pirellulaceae bacterium]
MSLNQVKAKRRRKIPWHRRLIYASLPTLLLFVGLELALRLADSQPVSPTADPLVGFSAYHPLFVPSPQDPTRLVTAPNKLVWFNAQAFPKRKAPGTRRVFCVGGSTTFGRPYSDNASYSNWLRRVLPALTGQDWEVINAGGVSYASYRVANVMEELAQYEPDLFIVYSVHNEFLERRTYADLFDRPSWLLSTQAVLAHSRVYSLCDRWLHADRPPAIQTTLPAEVDERLNHTVGPTDYHRDDVWRDQVLAHYRLNLQRMVAIARQAGAEILFITPASNEADCSPFKSELNEILTLAEQQEFADAIAAAEAAIESDDLGTAAAQWSLALQIDPQHANTHYCYAQTLSQLGQADAAHRAFRTAIENDICPLRATADISTMLRQVAGQLSVPLVDFEQRLHDQCQRETSQPSLGGRYFLDHVHPTPDVHRMLAMWIIDALQQLQLAGGTKIFATESQPIVDRVESDIAASMDRNEQGVALRNLAKVLHWSGKYAEAAPRASDALELLPRDLESRYVLADCLTNLGEPQASMSQYELLFEDGEFPRAYIPYAELLVAQGNFAKARSYALLAVLATPENAYAYLLLGKIHFELGEIPFAIDALEQASQLSPGNTATQELLKSARQVSQQTSTPPP